jgi:flavin reductase (DIM6/NTAB) family NADH-FMN oxidoreductase RutF
VDAAGNGSSELRRTLERLPAGVYVLAAKDGDSTGAATVAWVTQVAFKPPLLVVALGRRSNVFRCLERSRFATLHVVGQNQLALARTFACPTDAGGGRINGEPFVAGLTSSPVLTAFPAYVECSLEQILDTGGEHALVVLRAVHARCRSRFRPMMAQALRDYLRIHPLPARDARPEPAAAISAPQSGREQVVGSG